MKDPTQEIVDGVETILSGNLTYDGTTYSIVQDLPRVVKFRHVWLRTIRANEEGTKDKYLTNCELEIEVVGSGYKHKGARAAINSITNQLLQLLIDQSITLTNFTLFIKPHTVSMFEIEEMLDDDIIKRKNITMQLSVQQN